MSLQMSLTGYTVRAKKQQEKTRTNGHKKREKLNGHDQTRPSGHGHYLGRCQKNGSRKSRRVSMCDPMHPPGCTASHWVELRP